MKSYNQIINILLNFATGHHQVNSAGEGFSADLNEFLKNNEQGSFLFFEPRSIQQNSNLIDYVIRVYSVDFKQKDNNNLRDIISDTSQILVDLRKYLINNWEDNDIFSTQFDSVQLLPVNNFSADYLAGWYMDVRISAALIEGDCDIPATIQNCPPVAFYLNDTLVGTAFDELFYEVVDVSGSQVGSIVGGQWVVNFEDYSIENGNGGVFGTISPVASGGTFNTSLVSVFDGPDGSNFYETTHLPLKNIRVTSNLTSLNLSPDNLTLSLISAPPCFSFPLPVNNSNDDTYQTITGCPETNVISLNDFDVRAEDEFLGSYPVSSVIQLSGGTVQGVNYNSSTTTLNIQLQPCPTGLIYNRPQYTQDFVQEPGDEGWNVLNAVYDYTPTGATLQVLDYGSGNPYYTLKHNNIYGNKNRFTNSTGGTVFPGPDNLVIDHLSGLMYADVITSAGSLANNISQSTGYTVAGYSDWRMASFDEIQNLLPYGDPGPTSAITSGVLSFATRTSTAFPDAADFTMVTFAIKAFSRVTKTNTAYRPVFVRTHLY